MINKFIYVAVLGAAVILPGAFLFLTVWSYRKWHKNRRRFGRLRNGR